MSLRDLNERLNQGEGAKPDPSERRARGESDRSSDSAGFVRRKIANAEKVNPVRKRNERREQGAVDPLRALPVKIRTLLSHIEDQDIEEVAKVYRSSLKAVRRYWDQNTGDWAFEPDHRLRLQAAEGILAYSEGLPVARQVTLSATFGSLDQVLARLAESPVAQAALLGTSAPADQESIDVETEVSKD